MRSKSRRLAAKVVGLELMRSEIDVELEQSAGDGVYD
jgi:hypothetical protein